MIFDRTASDVESARQIISQKVQQFLELTEDEIAILEKGCVTVDTLNRIENAQKGLTASLVKMRYTPLGVANKEWTFDDIFNENDFNRIIDNLTRIEDAFFVYNATPKTPTPKYHYQNFNDIEKILFDVSAMIDDVKSNYRECGTFQCGEVI